MEFLEEFKSTLRHTMQREAYKDARVLMQGFHRTKTPYDAELYYLEAALCYYGAHYPTAAFFARLGYEKYPDYLPFQELLGCLAAEGRAYDDYQPKPTFDCSFLNRPLRIVLYEGVLPMMDYTAEQFRKTFELLGHEVFVFYDKSFTDSAASLLSFARKGIDFVLLFNNVGAALTDDRNRNFWEQMNILCVNYLFDHPLYYHQQMEDMPKNTVVTCVDRNHAAYIRRYHKNIKHTFFFPLGAEYIPFPQETMAAGETMILQEAVISQETMVPQEAMIAKKPMISQETLIAWKNRPIDVLYVGSLKKTQDIPTSFMSRMIEAYLLGHTSLTYEAAAEHCLETALYILQKHGIDIAAIKEVHELEPLVGEYEEQIRELLEKTPQQAPYADTDWERLQDCLLSGLLQEYRYIDMNVNAHFRKAMIVTLVNDGVDVHVYGNGWEVPELEGHPHFHFCGLLSQTECIRKMQESKIVLNSMPWFKDGAHDRIFNAMLCHAVCVTDSSRYLAERFTDEKELAFYSLEEIDRLPRIVRGLLNHPEKAVAIAENGYQSAVLSHSWENRAMELLTRFMADDWE